MLRGSIEYNGHRYNVKGVDSSTTMRLRLETSNFDSIKLMGGENCDEDDLLWNRTFEVKQGKVYVETKVSRDANNKKVKAPINTDMFCKLGASIQYIKSHCYIKNSVGIVGIQLASGDFEPEAVREYEIQMGYDVAEVSLRFGVVTKLKYDTDNIKVSLEEDFYDSEILYAVKDGIQKGFLFKDEYLGFSPEADIKNFESDFVDDELLCKDLEEVIMLHPEKSFSWLRGKDYHIVTDDTLEEVCDYILNFDDYVYFDTETTGLNINFMSRTGGADQCVGIILSVKDGESFFFPMQMKYIKNLCDGDHTYFMTRYMKEILEVKKIVCHNAPFDWKVAYIYDINANIVDDTMAILLVTIANEHRDISVSLKYQASEVLHRDSLELSDLVKNGDWGESDVKFWDLTEELTKYYACADTDNTRGLHKWEINNDLLGKYGARKIYEIELAFGFAVAYQEFYGHRVDIDNVDTLSEEIHSGIKKSKEKMVAMLGHDFNPNSSPQLINIMYNELGMPEKRSRKTGNLTSDKDTLKYFSEITDIDGNIKYPFAKELAHFRELEGVRKLIDKFPETMSLDGYIFSSVRQYGTTTGRVSVSDTNYQSYNDPVKKNIVPRPGFWMFDTDYSSIEYRVLGNMSGNEMIKESFYDPDFDYHTYQASRMYGVPYANVSSKLRKAAKGINFGLPYGMGDESLGIRIFGEKSDLNTRKAEQLRKKYFVGQEDIQDFFDTARNRGANEGYTETYFGRRRYYDKTKFTINAIRRQAGNQVIQGCIQLHTRILTQEYGIVEVGDHIGETLSVWDGGAWTQGTIVNSGKKRKCIVTFNGKHKIICSPNHKFMVLTKRGGKMWVRAEELHSRMEYRNPHRVAINRQSEYKILVSSYSSNSAYEYKGIANNSNNVFLEDIGDSYQIGLFLGRLASDGSQHIKSDGGSVIQIVAEHEYNILPKLRECMKNLNYVENEGNLRENRNEKLTRLGVYSKSLSSEIDDLDIRHKIHKNIFMDIDVLRGFLSGYFDGDGGISGKTITCTFGKQDDFKQLCDDMQTALLFFGIRSRFREYDDRYVLAIKTNDNDLFLNRIGFINSEKQEAGQRLECIEDEHTFGPCLVVESVEITDEYIDMCDVCNTERGYFVADGIITHNSSADIYKLAVGRVFKRICKEGWLGKVLLDGFIHDELLGEVSCDIDPMVFLKVLREEFEVKITNQDGSPWCPLYMGFGWGMSWYQAKKTEVPIKLQWEFVEKYGETGYPLWDGDGKKFCDSIPELITDFEIRDCSAQLLDSDNQGKEIKPALNSSIIEMVRSNKEKLEDEDLREKISAKNVDTQDAIDAFCVIYGVDRSKVNILSIPEIDESSSSQALAMSDTDLFDEDEDNIASALENAIFQRIEMLGMYVNTREKWVKMLLVPDNYMQFIKKRTVPEGSGGYRVMFRDVNKKIDYETKVELMSSEIPLIQSMYINLLKK